MRRPKQRLKQSLRALLAFGDVTQLQTAQEQACWFRHELHELTRLIEWRFERIPKQEQ